MNDRKLLSLIKGYKTVVIVGAAEIGDYLYYLIRSNGSQCIYIGDNSSFKRGKRKDYYVMSIEECINEESIYLITSEVHEHTLTNQLKDLGVEQRDIILAVTEEARTYLNDVKKEKKYKPLKKIQFEIDVTSHCNLNCKCCSQFSCIAKEEFLDIESMKNDFIRLGELFCGECERIYLIGGEPLLHPDIISIMTIARRYFPNGKISIFSNGLLLLKKEQEFWNECRKNEISLIVTKYPIPIKHDEIKKKADENHVQFEFFGASEDFKYMTNLGLDLDGKQNVEENFINCVESNNCIKLRQGRLYTCTRPAAIYRFNEYFGEKFKVDECDSIDIYENYTARDILEKLAKPIPFCRYCKMCGNERKAMDWGKTEGRIEEWL